MTADRPTFVFTVVDCGDPLAVIGTNRDAPYRVRLALKQMKRTFGLRCTNVRPAQPDDPTDTQTAEKQP